jgi:hypothetical protein
VKRLAMGLGLAVMLLGSPARAHDAYDDSQSHPLRLIAYAVYPVGVATEWLLTRPIHFLVSQPQLEHLFGHGPHDDPFGPYQSYDPDAH